MNSRGKAIVAGMMLAAGAIGAPAVSSAGVRVDIDLAPPAPRAETAPGPRMGYVWAPGYWDYRGGGHVWVPGRYLHERRGYHWVPDRWDPRGRRWHHERGHWER
jgi:hypothetical protein